MVAFVLVNFVSFVNYRFGSFKPDFSGACMCHCGTPMLALAST